MEALESRDLLTVGLNSPDAAVPLVDSGDYSDYRWHNVRRYADVNDNTNVSARDALLVINECLTAGSYEIPAEVAPQYYLDANADDWVSFLDSEVVIQALIAPGEGPLQNSNRPNLDLSAVTARTIRVGETLEFNLLSAGGTVVDLDESGNPTGDAIRLQLDPDIGTDTPLGASITPQGVFRWTPTAKQLGETRITVIAIDNGKPRRSDADTFRVIVSPTNHPPVVDLNGGSDGTGYQTVFTEDDGPVGIVAANELTVADLENPNLLSAVITLAEAGSEELLAVDTSGTAITASYSSVGVLQLVGNDTVAHYQKVLRTLTYDNASQDPGAASRTVTVTVSDGELVSSPATALIEIVPINDRPDLIPPLFNGHRSVVATIGQEITFTAEVLDPDSQLEQDELFFETYFVEGDSLNSSVPEISNYRGVFHWVPTHTGSFTILVSVDDGDTIDTETFSIIVGAQSFVTLEPDGTLRILGGPLADSAVVTSDAHVVTVAGDMGGVPFLGAFGFANVLRIDFMGGAGNDVIRNLTAIPMAAEGGEGDDLIEGGDEADRLLGDVGDDDIYGAGGNDIIAGGDGADFLDGESGDDVVLGGIGSDQLFGGLGDDELNGGAERDFLVGEDFEGSPLNPLDSLAYDSQDEVRGGLFDAADAVPGNIVPPGLSLSDRAHIEFVPTYAANVSSQLREAFESAIRAYENILVASYDGESITVSVDIRDLGPQTIASASAGRTVGQVLMPAHLANHLVKAERNAASATNQIEVHINSSFISFLQDGSAAAIAVFVHELTHGLGFVDFNMLNLSGANTPQNERINRRTRVVPSYYTSFLESGGKQLSHMSAAEVQNVLRSGSNVLWVGRDGVREAEHIGKVLKLYNPPVAFFNGSSLSHLDEADFHDYLMSFSAGPGDNTELSDIELGMLRDLGWDVDARVISDQSFKRWVENLSRSELANELPLWEDATLKRALELIDNATLKNALQEVDRATLGRGLELIATPVLARALQMIDARTLENAVGEISIDTIRRALPALDGPTRENVADVLVHNYPGKFEDLLESFSSSEIQSVIGRMTHDELEVLVDEMTTGPLAAMLPHLDGQTRKNAVARIPASKLGGVLVRLATPLLRDVLIAADSGTLNAAVREMDVETLGRVLNQLDTPTHENVVQLLLHDYPGKFEDLLGVLPASEVQALVGALDGDELEALVTEMTSGPLAAMLPDLDSQTRRNAVARIPASKLGGVLARLATPILAEVLIDSDSGTLNAAVREMDVETLERAVPALDAPTRYNVVRLLIQQYPGKFEDVLPVLDPSEVQATVGDLSRGDLQYLVESMTADPLKLLMRYSNSPLLDNATYRNVVRILVNDLPGDFNKVVGAIRPSDVQVVVEDLGYNELHLLVWQMDVGPVGTMQESLDFGTAFNVLKTLEGAERGKGFLASVLAHTADTPLKNFMQYLDHAGLSRVVPYIDQATYDRILRIVDEPTRRNIEKYR